MNAKTTRIRLKCESLGVHEFEISHAERILGMEKNGGWKLADEDYELTADGNIIRRHKEEARRGKKKGGSK